MRKFYSCSVGEAGKGYDEKNLNKIIEKKAFILHESTPQKGDYQNIKVNDILLLKYRGKFIAYGEALKIIKTTDKEWNLFAPVIEWFFFDNSNPSSGTEIYGMKDATLGGSQYGTVKPLEANFSFKKIKKINKESELFKTILQEFRKDIEIKNMEDKIKLLEYKKQIILQGPPGTGKTRMAKMMAEEMTKVKAIITEEKPNKTNLLSVSIIKSMLKIGNKIQGKSSKLFEIIKIEEKKICLKSAESKIWTPSYNKIIKSFNEELYKISGRTGGLKSYEDAIAIHLKKEIGDNFNPESISEDDENEYSDNVNIVQFHPSYTYEDFVRGIVSKSNENNIEYITEDKILIKISNEALQNPDKKYVLIIDEINRANLPSVLGELIYALEYRGTEVNSIYENNGDSRIELPNNLFIIGTMNTADRSVGHIDYAIKRRFAFVDILPEIEPVHPLIKVEFIKISNLFIKNFDGSSIPEIIERSESLASDFRPEDIWIGHSYFICKKENSIENEDDAIAKPILNMKLKHEIIPLLKEYIKDGILNETEQVKTVMNELISKDFTK